MGIQTTYGPELDSAKVGLATVQAAVAKAKANQDKNLYSVSAPTPVSPSQAVTQTKDAKTAQTDYNKKPGGVSTSAAAATRLNFAPITVVNAWTTTFGHVLSGAADSIYNTADSLNSNAAKIHRDTSTYVLRSFKPLIDNMDAGFGSAQQSISNLRTNIDAGFKSLSDSMHKSLSGVSTHTGAILGALDGVAKDPLNPDNIGNVVSSLMETVSPGSSQKLNGTFQKLNLDKISKAPGLLMGSVNHLITAIDNVLSVPIAFISEIYYGLMAIIKQIGGLINDLMASITNLLLDFLDSLIPIKQIMGFLDDVGTLAGQIGGIASVFGGVNAITGFALKITDFTTQVNGILSNPMNLISSYIPNNVNQYLYALQNPQTIIDQFLPPQLSQSLAKVSLITGYGFNGNMGYGFQSVLQGVQGGVIHGLASKFASQYSMLSPLIAGKSLSTPTNYTPVLVAGKYVQGDVPYFTPVTPYASKSTGNLNTVPLNLVPNNLTTPAPTVNPNVSVIPPANGKPID
jgi:hypothetical protein